MSDAAPGAAMAPQANHPDPAAAAAAAAAAQQLQQASPDQQHQQLQAHLQHQPLQQQSLAQQSLQQSPTIQHALQSPMQQHASPQPVQHVIGTPSLGQSSTVDSLTCQWLNCGERHQAAEALYEHVCERHVGRKSTNNLNLTCHWGSCRVTTVKRDHITSHIRVHVPLKPHKCDFCGKAFKRPQDLKKHVKTHADDSVLLRSPDPNMGQNRPPGNNYQQPAQATNGYYGHDMGANNGYPHPSHGLNSNSFFQQPPQQPQYAGYGQVNYPASNSLADIQSMDTRRRAIEALNDFLGDIKRRAIDPGNYYDVGQRLQSANLPLPISTGYGYSTGNNYASNNNSSYSAASSLLDSFNNSGNLGMTGSSGGSMSQGPLTQSYSLPLPSNARTKQDLVEIDKFLEQLQATVYESSSSAAAAGVQQPGSHSQYTNYPGFGGSQYRNSDSPPSMQHSGSVSTPGLGMPSGSAMETPALTPASVSSYTSAGQSPMSTHSRSSMSSAHGSSMYPSLPSVTAISDMGAGYPATTSAPASGLASGFEGFEGRRYSGGRLQREAPAPRSQDMDSDAMETESDGAKTPRASTKQPEDSSALDPALRAASQTSTAVQSPSTGAGSDSDEKQATWVENVRVIEALRRWVSERINNSEFEGESEYPEPQHHDDHDMHMDHHQPSDEKTLENHYEQVHHPEHEQHEQHEQQAAPEVDADVAYPVLKLEE